MNELATKYNPAEVEDKWYKYWMDHDLFKSTPDEREPYTIVIPPPNVTGVLHMGHMLNNTIQDILIRRARMEGKNACWVPGTDHASIATEAKVVKRLAEQGIKMAEGPIEDYTSQVSKVFIRAPFQEIARDYLEPLRRVGVDTLVLGCTHFPLIKALIGGVVGHNVKLISSAEACHTSASRTSSASFWIFMKTSIL